MKVRFLVVAALIASALALAPGTARAGSLVRLGEPFPPPVVIVPQVYPPVIYGYGAPVGAFESWWDPDYRAIRYNRYFQRYQETPRIYGFTLH
jgi:hypothetical protein